MNKCAVCGAECKRKYCSKKCQNKGQSIRRRERLGLLPRFNGCDEDCFNCPYPDCVKPYHKFKTDNATKSALAVRGGESAPRHYTVELGGFGGARPNLSKKFYL